MNWEIADHLFAIIGAMAFIPLLLVAKKKQRVSEFYSALRAAYHYMRDQWNVPHWRLAGFFFRMLKAYLFGIQVPFGVYKRRIKLGCRRCPLYDDAKRVCGSYQRKLAVISGHDEPVRLTANVAPEGIVAIVPDGCRCWIPLKARYWSGVCYMEDIGLPSRWPDSPNYLCRDEEE